MMSVPKTELFDKICIQSFALPKQIMDPNKTQTYIVLHDIVIFVFGNLCTLIIDNFFVLKTCIRQALFLRRRGFAENKTLCSIYITRKILW